MLNGNGAAFINVEIIGGATSGKATASNSATTTSAAYVKIEAYYKLLYTQATLKYAHSIDEAIEHEDAEMAEMIGEATLYGALGPAGQGLGHGSKHEQGPISSTTSTCAAPPRRTIHRAELQLLPTATSRRSSMSSSRRFLHRSGLLRHLRRGS